MSATPDASDVPVDITMREINELVRLFEASDLKGLELEMRGIRLVLGTPSAAPAPAGAVSSAPAAAPAPVPEVAAAPATPTSEQTAPATAPAAPAAPEPVATGTGKLIEVTAPVVGTFWTAPSPGEPPFVQVGDVVAKGQQLAIVEVMKLMSPVSAPVAGRVVEMLVGNAELVEYEQVVLVIESSDA